jgi:hypothetical protein
LICAGGPATRQHKGPFYWLKVAGGCRARQQKLVLAAKTNRFWPSENLKNEKEKNQSSLVI